MMTLNSPHRTNRQVTKGRKYVCQSCCLQQNIYLLDLFSHHRQETRNKDQHSAHCETWSIAEVRLAGCTASVSAQSTINCEMWYLIEFSKSSYPISPGLPFFWAACNSAGYSMLGLLSKSRGTVQCKMHQILVYSTRHAANSLHKSTAKQCSGTGSNNNLLWPVRCHLNMQLTLSSSSTVPSIYCLKTLYRVNVVFPVFIWHLSTHQSQTKLKNWSLNHSYRPAPGI